MLKYDEVKHSVTNHEIGNKFNGICGDWKYEIEIRCSCINVHLKNKSYDISCQVDSKSFVKMNINEYIRYINNAIGDKIKEEHETIKESDSGQLEFAF